MSRSRIARPVAAFLAFALVQTAFGGEAWAQVAVLGRAAEGGTAAAVSAVAVARPIELAPTLGGGAPILAAPSILSVAPSPVAAGALPALAAASATPISAAPTASAAAALPALAAASAPTREREGNDPRAAAGAAFDGAAAKRSPLEALEAGERVYAPEPAGAELDGQTAADLEVDALHSQLAAKARTAYGAQRLKALLARPFWDAGEIRRRQDAVRELANDPTLGRAVSEALAQAAPDAHAKARESFLSYGADKATFLIAAPFGLAALYLLGSTVTHVVAAVSWRPVLGLLQYAMIWMMIGGGMVPRLQAVRAELRRLRAATRAAAALAGPLSQSRSEALREIGGVFSAVTDKDHPLGLKGLAGRLSRLLPEPAAGVLDFLYMHSAFTLWPAARAVARKRAELATLLGALGELDAHAALAETSRAVPGWNAYPEILDDAAPRLTIEDGNHPFLAARGGSVPNDARLEPGANFALLTGVNMGGKSTYLKMTALLALLAQIGAPVPAAAMALTPLELMTSIEIRHNLREGKSLYDAETDRILSVIRRAETSPRLLVLIDEILQGTNPQDRAAIERAVARWLAGTGRLFVVATHNLDVVSLEGEQTGVRNLHVDESADGRPAYKVLPGPSTTRNAVDVLARKGFPVPIVDEARGR